MDVYLCIQWIFRSCVFASLVCSLSDKEDAGNGYHKSFLFKLAWVPLTQNLITHRIIFAGLAYFRIAAIPSGH